LDSATIAHNLVLAPLFTQTEKQALKDGRYGRIGYYPIGFAEQVRPTSSHYPFFWTTYSIQQWSEKPLQSFVDYVSNLLEILSGSAIDAAHRIRSSLASRKRHTTANRSRNKLSTESCFRFTSSLDASPCFFSPSNSVQTSLYGCPQMIYIPPRQFSLCPPTRSQN